MSEDLSALRHDALGAIAACNSTAALEDARITWLGKKGRLTELMKQLGGMEPETRKAFGAAVNEVKLTLTEALDARKSTLAVAELEVKLLADAVDITLPARAAVHHPQAGRVHPITQVMDEITTLFSQLGFHVAEGPDIEDDEHNFNALNIPESHPARQMHDTFYLTGGEVLRTHTSPVQIRTMRAGKPPFRAIAPGSTYRSDSDQTHTPMFHQVEGFVVDKDITMAHLKWTLSEFLREFFELDEVPVRFRPSFFPFTEPSAEVDIGCKRSKDQLVIGGGDDWLEVLGCGMIHPNVLKNCGLDPEEWQGFAFGMGVERLAMLKYGIPDLRSFFEPDTRWLKHYGFCL